MNEYLSQECVIQLLDDDCLIKVFSKVPFSLFSICQRWTNIENQFKDVLKRKRKEMLFSKFPFLQEPQPPSCQLFKDVVDYCISWNNLNAFKFICKNVVSIYVVGSFSKHLFFEIEKRNISSMRIKKRQKLFSLHQQGGKKIFPILSQSLWFYQAKIINGTIGKNDSLSQTLFDELEIDEICSKTTISCILVSKNLFEFDRLSKKLLLFSKDVFELFCFSVFEGAVINNCFDLVNHIYKSVSSKFLKKHIYRIKINVCTSSEIIYIISKLISKNISNSKLIVQWIKNLDLYSMEIFCKFLSISDKLLLLSIIQDVRFQQRLQQQDLIIVEYLRNKIRSYIS